MVDGDGYGREMGKQWIMLENLRMPAANIHLRWGNPP
jgi:hypothetical protein